MFTIATIFKEIYVVLNRKRIARFNKYTIISYPCRFGVFGFFASCSELESRIPPCWNLGIGNPARIPRGNPRNPESRNPGIPCLAAGGDCSESEIGKIEKSESETGKAEIILSGKSVNQPGEIGNQKSKI